MEGHEIDKTYWISGVSILVSVTEAINEKLQKPSVESKKYRMIEDRLVYFKFGFNKLMSTISPYQLLLGN